MASMYGVSKGPRCNSTYGELAHKTHGLATFGTTHAQQLIPDDEPHLIESQI